MNRILNVCNSVIERITNYKRNGGACNYNNGWITLCEYWWRPNNANDCFRRTENNTRKKKWSPDCKRTWMTSWSKWNSFFILICWMFIWIFRNHSKFRRIIKTNLCFAVEVSSHSRYNVVLIFIRISISSPLMLKRWKKSGIWNYLSHARSEIVILTR